MIVARARCAVFTCNQAIATSDPRQCLPAGACHASPKKAMTAAAVTSVHVISEATHDHALATNAMTAAVTSVKVMSAST